jgi:sugar lactone lactonase YvrE
VCIATVLVACAVPPPAAAQQPHSVSVFSRVPDPGQPEGIAVGPDGAVYVGTNNAGDGTRMPRQPSKIFAYDPNGTLKREYVVSGQDTSNNLYGVYGLAADAGGNVYFADRVPPRIVKLDVATGAQSDYARFPDLKPCGPSPGDTPCSRTNGDQAPFPNGLSFGPANSLYVTDAAQAAVWRILPGGGDPTLVRSDPLLEAPVAGPNGIVVDSDGRTMTFAQSNFPPGPTPETANGRIYRLPLSGAGALKLVWEGRPFDVPDGIALAKSGNIWVALAGPDQVGVIDPTGREVARVPASMVENSQQEIPFDKPASVAFLGKRVLVTNQSLFNRDPQHWAVLAIEAGEEGVKPFGPGGKLKLKITPRRVRAGRARFGFHVTGPDGRAVGGARIAVGRRRTGTNIEGNGKMQVRVSVPGLRKAVVTAPGYEKARASYRVLPRRR